MWKWMWMWMQLWANTHESSKHAATAALFRVFFGFLWIWRRRDIYISSSLASKKRVLLTGERLKSKSSSSLIISFNSRVLLASSNFNEAIVGQHTFEFCGKHSNFTRKSNIGFFFSQIFFRYKQMNYYHYFIFWSMINFPLHQ